jgi:prepilin-type N-terminal cleavage/methylation domain-containing protein/prepilin-type processing-associated H-X9-DG protein
MKNQKNQGFTLLELLCSIAIIATLAALAFPVFHTYRDKADGVTCVSNLRQLGSAVQNYVARNDGRYPEIETDPQHPVYPEDEHVKGMQETLEEYGVTKEVVKCPADLKSYNFFAKVGSSYEWRPFVDDELQSNPTILTRGGQRTVPPSKIVIAFDVERVHGMSSDFRSKKNYLYGDGHVRAYWDTAPRIPPKN